MRQFELTADVVGVPAAEFEFKLAAQRPTNSLPKGWDDLHLAGLSGQYRLLGLSSLGGGFE